MREYLVGPCQGIPMRNHPYHPSIWEIYCSKGRGRIPGVEADRTTRAEKMEIEMGRKRKRDQPGTRENRDRRGWGRERKRKGKKKR